MEIKTKYSIGDIVYTYIVSYFEQKVVPIVVDTIIIKKNMVYYTGENVREWFREDLCYTTAEEANKILNQELDKVNKKVFCV